MYAEKNPRPALRRVRNPPRPAARRQRNPLQMLKENVWYIVNIDLPYKKEYLKGTSKQLFTQ